MGGVYPDPNISNLETMYGYAHTVTDGYLGVTFVATCAIIVFALMMQRGYRTSQCLATSGIISMVLSSFIWAMGYIQSQYILFCLVIGVIGVIWSTIESK